MADDGAPYRAPASAGAAAAGASLPWVRAAAAVLAFCGLMYGLLGMGYGVFAGMGFLAGPDPEPDGMERVLGVLVGVWVAVIGTGIGVANLVAAWGVWQRAKWAWYVGVILGAIYAPSGCLPFGVVVLVALLREDGRRAFGITG